ncbi:NADH:ubiquinone reductase (Na(+)-transporting) subunit F [Marinovum sp.]|uniref:NADH:ubiquinone reductase (Na(+)-transporting) subunit F n=1 Tax=Marinovum sp. TaxID=2024839 RepID=UPI003A939979
MTEIVLASGVVVALVILLTFGLLTARRRLIPEGGVDVTVNGAVHLVARRSSTLLEALHGSGLLIPAACGGSGTCGLCRVTVTGAGAGTPGATERGTLSPQERRAHVRLACQTRLRGDCTVTLPEAIMTSGGGFTCTVASTRMLAPLIREIVLRLPEDRPLNFEAGDFLQVTAPPFQLDFAAIDLPDRYREAWEFAGLRTLKARSDSDVTRAYSLASRPEDQGQAVLNIRLAVPPAGREENIPPGIVSSWLFSLSPGDQVTTSGPFGEFHVHPGEQEMVFVGGGVGMAPLRAMIHQTFGRGTKRRVRYLYGARSAIDLFYAEEFDALAEAHPNFTWTPALSDPAPGDRWTGATGFIHEVLAAEMRAHPAPESCEYYLCGPPVMISAVLATLDRLGVERRSVFFDDFGS